MAKDIMNQLEDMSLEELKALHKEVTRAVTSYEERKKQEAREQLEKQAKELGFSLSDLTGKVKTKRTPAAPKYANPENHADTWSGRGRKPKWLEEAIAQGHDMEEFTIENIEKSSKKRKSSSKKDDGWDVMEVSSEMVDENA